MKYKRYEQFKRRLQTLNLTPAQYQAVIQILAEALGI